MRLLHQRQPQHAIQHLHLHRIMIHIHAKRERAHIRARPPLMRQYMDWEIRLLFAILGRRDVEFGLRNLRALYFCGYEECLLVGPFQR